MCHCPNLGSVSLLVVMCKGFSPLQGSEVESGEGQGKDFLTLNRPLTLMKGQGFLRGFSGFILL